jgi:hypothetical protein
MAMAVQSGVRFPQKLSTQLPTPAAYKGMGFYCPDTDTLVISNGTRWRPFARSIYVGRQTCTSTGIVNFVYDVPFVTMMPCLSVTLSDIGGTGRLSYAVTAESLTGCTVQVKRGSTLPGIALSLLGFDPFASGIVTGVVVNLTALPQM